MTEHHHKNGDGTDIDDILSTLINHEKPVLRNPLIGRSKPSRLSTHAALVGLEIIENQSEGVLTP